MFSRSSTCYRYTGWFFALLLSPFAVLAGSDRILFVSTAGGNAQIYRINADGSGAQQLTAGAAENTQPAWSPDGRQIAFTSVRDGNTDLYLMGERGGEAMRLTRHPNPDSAPAWSPDGRSIAFLSYRDRHANLYLLDPQSGAIQRLTESAGDKGPPHWSPDGRWVLYSRHGERGRQTLHIVNTETKEDRNITQADVKGKITQAAWAPDGGAVTFTVVSRGGSDIYSVDIHNTHLSRVTESIYEDVMPAWSPTGNRLAFVSNRYAALAERSAGDIYVMSRDGGLVVNLTRNALHEERPKWTSDGQSILYLSIGNGASILNALQLEGGEALSLTGSDGHVLMFTISPDSDAEDTRQSAAESVADELS